MNSPFLKKIIPHAIAVFVFLLVSVIYCSPALEGKVVQQHDIAAWDGANKQSVDFREIHGHYPLWTNSLFSGMPTFQIAFDGNNKVPWILHQVFTLGLPQPTQFFFIACICFYFLSLVFGVSPVISILGALTFAYSTYNPVIISAGHVTKMLSIAYMPALLASLLLIYNKRYWIGAGLTALFTSILIAMNHLQIDYYLFLTIGIMTVFFAVRWIREKNWKHLIWAALFSVGGAFIGLATNAVMLLTTYEYQKETIRGGASELSESKENSGGKDQKGLDKSYAFSYSIYPSESFVLMIPHIYGGSSDKDERGEHSKAVETLSSFPRELQSQLPLTYYWGGIGYTSGPPYVGVITCFLALLGLVVLKGKHKWWLLTAILLSLFMSWGQYFDSFNSLLFDYLPLYNKFRAPSMILVIPQLLLPLMAVLTLHNFFSGDNTTLLQAQLKKGLIVTGGVLLALFLLYFSFSFQSEGDRKILQQVSEMGQPQLTEMIRSFFSALADDRRALMLNDLLRALGLIALTTVALFLFIKRSLKPLTATVILIVASFIDLISVDSTYLNKENFLDPEENNFNNFALTEADKTIMQDTGYFRVFNISGDAFNENKTSYYHNSVGGYHAAKLRIYQDLIENQLSKSPLNRSVLNMLNTRYLIQTNPQTGQKMAIPNPDALGPAWLVKDIQFVAGAREEMNSLDQFNPRDTAYVRENFRSSIPFMPQADSTATIQLLKNNNDTLLYQFHSQANQFAVFSEIYYNDGWKAYIDGKEAPIVRVNYVLRGLAVPAGQHTIEFRFEPSSYYSGRKITSISSTLMLLLLAGSIFAEWRRRKTTGIPNNHLV